MQRSIIVLFLSIVPTCFLIGCGEQKPYRKPTAKVTGQLTIDGNEPGDAILVKCVTLSEEDTDPSHTSMSETMSTPDGKFEISTYQKGDGVPNGEYVLTFMWGTMNVMSRTYGGPDKLKNRYTDPKTSETKFTVAGVPVDLGVIELTIPDDASSKEEKPRISVSAGAEESIQQMPKVQRPRGKKQKD